ncbi:MAG: hypothetical protein WC542_11060, partial [Paludibacter sp.]
FEHGLPYLLINFHFIASVIFVNHITENIFFQRGGFTPVVFKLLVSKNIQPDTLFVASVPVNLCPEDIRGIRTSILSRHAGDSQKQCKKE